MCKGFIRVSRERASEFEWLDSPNICYCFFRLLLMANYKDSRWQGIDVKRGQLLTGRKALSVELNLTEKEVRTCLEKLKKSGYIDQQTTNRYTIITICNYDIWQDCTNTMRPTNGQPCGQQTANKRPTNGQQTATREINKENKEKEINKEKEKKVKRKIFDVRADLSYVNADYYPIWIEWLDYKDKIKKQYKTDVGAKKQYTHLVKLSNGDTNKAKAIVDQSIMREYEGLFDVKGYKSPAMSIDERAKKNGFPYKDEFGRHYETMFDRNLHQNSYEEYMSKKNTSS